MYPVLFSLPQGLWFVGGFKLHTYGLMVAIGFLVANYWIEFCARQRGFVVKQIQDLFFYVMLGGIVGARVMYVFFISKSIYSDFFSLFRVWEGGMVFQGGVIGALLFGAIYSRRHKLDFWKLSDIFVLGLCLGHFFGRLGCFFAGCCYGRVCPLDFWGKIVYPLNELSLAPANVPLFAVQIYEAFGNLFLFAILWYSGKRFKMSGSVFFLYMILYGVMRFAMELLRGDSIRGLIGNYSTGQVFSLVAIALASLFWCKRVVKYRLK